ncbi:antitoxin Xre/MbcA/ParS toxin-binding domain-containing protein [Demequina capsici]|nr:antitoxin Xre/MbcA/ParS toxin-binding domain-containing protein [Demequina sp. OYTSA14]WNM24513.1 antitoxin Xre/MbcA/ParS toxin-binding domain-containing protein [Demequina sp. OYTSA14]
MGPTIAQAVTGVDPTGSARLASQVRLAHATWTVAFTAMGRDRAIEWITKPNPLLGGRTPLCAIRDLDAAALHCATVLVAYSHRV